MAEEEMAVAVAAVVMVEDDAVVVMGRSKRSRMMGAIGLSGAEGASAQAMQRGAVGVRGGREPGNGRVWRGW